MSKENRNIEDFLKDKLDGLDQGFQNDWSVFEEKLERALFFYRMKVGAMVSALLILLSLGIFGTSAFMGTDSSGDERVAVEQPNQELKVEQVESDNTVITTPAEVPSNDFNSDVAASTEGTSAIPNNQVIANENTEGKVDHATDVNGKAADIRPVDEGTAIAAVPVNSQVSSANTTADKSNQTDKADSDEAGLVTTGAGIAESVNQNSNLLGKSAGGASSMNMSGTTAQVSKGSAAPVILAGSKATPSNQEIIQGVSQGYHERPAIAEGEDPSTPVAANSKVTKIARIEHKPTFTFDEKKLDELFKMEGESDLGLRPPVMPVELKKAGPYISPLQDKNLWSYSLSIYPNFTFRKFKVDKDKMNYIHRDFIDATQAAERGGFSLNIGVRASRRIGPITYLNGGIEYINYKTQAEFDFTNFREANINPQTNEITHYTILSKPEQIIFSDDNNYHYLNFPFSISHQPWASDQVQLNIEAGVSYMYFLAAEGKSINYQTLEIIDISERDYRNSIASFQFKVGATYHISRTFNLGFEPTFVYFTNTIYTEEYPFEVIPYSVGVNLKLQIKL